MSQLFSSPLLILLQPHNFDPNILWVWASDKLEPCAMLQHSNCLMNLAKPTTWYGATKDQMGRWIWAYSRHDRPILHAFGGKGLEWAKSEVWLTCCLVCLDSAALLMMNEQQFYLFDQIQTSQTGGQLYSDTFPFGECSLAKQKSWMSIFSQSFLKQFL